MEEVRIWEKINFHFIAFLETLDLKLFIKVKYLSLILPKIENDEPDIQIYVCNSSKYFTLSFVVSTFLCEKMQGFG